MAETLTALSQRNEAFWIGLALFLLGVITNEAFGATELPEVLVIIGGGILLIRILVGCFRILKTTAVAGKIGYLEGQQNGK